MAGTNGGKVCMLHVDRVIADSQFPEIREHFQKNIGDVYKGLDLNFRGFPEGNLRDAEACTPTLSVNWMSADRSDKSALKALPKGSAVIIFTPDSTHFPIASEALEQGHHVLVTKPATQKVEDHQKLIDMAKEKGLICFVEHHKRFE